MAARLKGGKGHTVLFFIPYTVSQIVLQISGNYGQRLYKQSVCLT